MTFVVLFLTFDQRKLSDNFNRTLSQFIEYLLKESV